MIVNTTVKQGSPEWFALHVAIPSGSELDRIVTPGGKLCKSEVSTRYRNRKLAEFITGESILGEYENDHMALGKENEPHAVKAFMLQTGRKCTEVGFITRDDGLVGVSPDRIIDGIDTLEVKCPAMQTHIGYLLDPDSLIAAYRVQLHAENWICGGEAWVMSYHPKLPPLILKVPIDPEFIKKMEDAVNAWLDDMLAKRAELEMRYGPFVRKNQQTEENPFGISDQDLEDFMKGVEKRQ